MCWVHCYVNNILLFDWFLLVNRSCAVYKKYFRAVSRIYQCVCLHAYASPSLQTSMFVYYSCDFVFAASTTLTNTSTCLVVWQPLARTSGSLCTPTATAWCRERARSTPSRWRRPPNADTARGKTSPVAISVRLIATTSIN